MILTHTAKLSFDSNSMSSELRRDNRGLYNRKSHYFSGCICLYVCAVTTHGSCAFALSVSSREYSDVQRSGGSMLIHKISIDQLSLSASAKGSSN